MVLKATKRADVSGIQIDEHAMHFGKKSNAFIVNDPGIAREIEAEHGARETGEVVVIRQPRREAGHRYSFAVPALPWQQNSSSDKDK